MGSGDGLLSELSAVALLGAFGLYALQTFFTDPIVLPKCRVQMSATVTALFGLLALQTAFLVVAPGRVFPITLVEVLAAAALIAILFLFITQVAVPKYRASQLEQARNGYAIDLTKILLGGSPKGTNTKLAADALSSRDLTYLSKLSKKQMLDLADLMRRLKKDTAAKYNPKGIWDWLNDWSVAGGVRAGLGAIDLVLARIDALAEEEELSEAEQLELDGLKSALAELKDAKPKELD